MEGIVKNDGHGFYTDIQNVYKFNNIDPWNLRMCSMFIFRNYLLILFDILTFAMEVGIGMICLLWCFCILSLRCIIVLLKTCVFLQFMSLDKISCLAYSNFIMWCMFWNLLITREFWRTSYFHSCLFTIDIKKDLFSYSNILGRLFDNELERGKSHETRRGGTGSFWKPNFVMLGNAYYMRSSSILLQNHVICSSTIHFSINCYISVKQMVVHDSRYIKLTLMKTTFNYFLLSLILTYNHQVRMRDKNYRRFCVVKHNFIDITQRKRYQTYNFARTTECTSHMTVVRWQCHVILIIECLYLPFFSEGPQCEIQPVTPSSMTKLGVKIKSQKLFMENEWILQMFSRVMSVCTVLIPSQTLLVDVEIEITFVMHKYRNYKT